MPWEDVFEGIEPRSLAAGSIAQVHRATLANGDRVVVKIQRPGLREIVTYQCSSGENHMAWGWEPEVEGS